MWMKHAAVAVATLALAGCGEEQAAQNNPAPRSTPPATQQGTTPPPPAAPSATGQQQGSVPARPDAQATRTEPAGPQAAPSASSPGAPAVSAFRNVLGREFQGGPVTLRLEPDNRFVFRNQEGRSVTGLYAFDNGIVTLRDPQGDVGDARFPMRCRFEHTSDAEFLFRDVDGECRQLSNVAFRAGM